MSEKEALEMLVRLASWASSDSCRFRGSAMPAMGECTLDKMLRRCALYVMYNMATDSR